MCKMHCHNKEQQKIRAKLLPRSKKDGSWVTFKVKIMCKMHCHNKKQQKIRAKLLPRSKKNGSWVFSRQKLCAKCTVIIRNNKRFGRSYYQDQRRIKESKSLRLPSR